MASKAVTALLQLVGAEMDYRFDVCHVTKGEHIEQLQSIKGGGGRVSLSICTSHVTILPTIQVYGFYKMCQRIMNNPVQDITVCVITIRMIQ